MSTSSNELIKSCVDRIEVLEEEKKGLSDDIKDIYAEAKSQGLNKKALRAIIARRKQERAELEALDADVLLYEGVLNA
jgi:uncharacterized protein (UPF0335 family)